MIFAQSNLSTELLL